MPVDLNSLLYNATVIPENLTSAIIVSCLPEDVNFLHLHRNLTKAFAKTTPPRDIDLRSADLLFEDDYQECLLKITPAIDFYEAEILIRDALQTALKSHFSSELIAYAAVNPY